MSWWLEETTRKLAETAHVPGPVKRQGRPKEGDWTHFDSISREERWEREFRAAAMGDVCPDMRWRGIEGRFICGPPCPPGVPVLDVAYRSVSLWYGTHRPMAEDRAVALALCVPLVYIQTWMMLWGVPFSGSCPPEMLMMTRFVSEGVERRHAWMQQGLVNDIADDLRDHGVELGKGANWSRSDLRGLHHWIVRTAGLKMETAEMNEFGRTYCRGIDPFTGEPLKEKIWHGPEDAVRRLLPKKKEKPGARRMLRPLEDRLRQNSHRAVMRISRDSLPTYFAFRRRQERSNRWCSTFLSKSAGS